MNASCDLNLLATCSFGRATFCVSACLFVSSVCVCAGVTRVTTEAVLRRKEEEEDIVSPASSSSLTHK